MIWERSSLSSIPKSYKDTTGNGIRDFRGIIEKIPYLANWAWIWSGSTHFIKPQRDNGYDISDYMSVDPCFFGDMADFEREMVRVGKSTRLTLY